MQGKTVPCPSCKVAFKIRLAEATPPPTARPIPPAGPLTARRIAATPKAPAPLAPKPMQPPATRKASQTARPPLSAFSNGRPRLLYLVFAVAFVPLIFQTLGSKSDVEERIEHMVSANPALQKELEDSPIDSEDDLFSHFPDGRIEGAHLSHFSHTHWAYAGVATAIFFAAVWFLFERGTATIAQWLIVLAVTSTVGVISLLIFQWIAAVTQGVWLTGRSIIVLLFYIVKFIGFSYSVADNPEYGFWASFFGFTFGVGLCEELTKALPVVVYLQSDKKLDWRAACLLGLASGVGFGVAEGIIYAGQHYNGVAGVDIYFTRFISCVALHATWTASVALMAVQNRDGLETEDATDWLKSLLLIVAVPAILHGLYDTLLKRDMGGLALLIALASFAWLAFMIERARSSDTEYTPRRAMRADV